MKTIQIEEVLKKLFSENLEDDLPDFGTVAFALKETRLHLNVNRKYASVLFPDDTFSDEIVQIELDVEDYLGAHFKEDFLCHFRVKSLCILPEELEKTEFEDWINECIADAIFSFNMIQILDLGDDNELYVELPPYPRVSLENLNSDWTDLAYKVEGENVFEDDQRRNQIRSW